MSHRCAAPSAPAASEPDQGTSRDDVGLTDVAPEMTFCHCGHVAVARPTQAESTAMHLDPRRDDEMAGRFVTCRAKIACDRRSAVGNEHSEGGGISRENLNERAQQRLAAGRLMQDRARCAFRGNFDRSRVDYVGYTSRRKALEEDDSVVLAQNEIKNGHGQCWVLGKTQAILQRRCDHHSGVRRRQGLRDIYGDERFIFDDQYRTTRQIDAHDTTSATYRGLM